MVISRSHRAEHVVTVAYMICAVLHQIALVDAITPTVVLDAKVATDVEWKLPLPWNRSNVWAKAELSRIGDKLPCM